MQKKSARLSTLKAFYSFVFLCLMGFYSSVSYSAEITLPDIRYRVKNEKSLRKIKELLRKENMSLLFERFSPKQEGWTWERQNVEPILSKDHTFRFDIKKGDGEDSSSYNLFSRAARFVESSIMSGDIIGGVNYSDIDCETPYDKLGQQYEVDFTEKSSTSVLWFIKSMRVQICSSSPNSGSQTPLEIKLKMSFEPGEWFPGLESDKARSFLKSQQDAWWHALFI